MNEKLKELLQATWRIVASIACFAGAYVVLLWLVIWAFSPNPEHKRLSEENRELRVRIERLEAEREFDRWLADFHRQCDRIERSLDRLEEQGGAR